jgi:hypothetical protein
LVSVAGLALAIADYFRPEEPLADPARLADDLAGIVRDQWSEEAGARRLYDPGVLPLRWSATRREVADSLEATLGFGQPGRVTGLRVDGRLEGRFVDAVAQLATGYRRIPSGRLVVIGEPGAGKSVLAILLTLGLVGSRPAGSAVPVLLTASSWDPISEGLDEWIIRTLAATYYTGRPQIPRRLLDRGLLLPILDGLDEIPESGRRVAVRAINQAVGSHRPIVVTCRAAEYEDVITGGAPVLRRAPVIEVAPVPASDLIVYLRAVDWQAGVVWDQVYDHLRANPDGAVAAALSTPLMVSLARLVYQRLGGNPAGLLDPAVFDCRHAVEDFLTDRLIDAAYAPDPLPSGQPQAGPPGRWSAAQARRWLTFLARYLHRHRDRDLAWWQLAGRLLSPWTGIALGLASGIVLMAVSSATLAAVLLGPLASGVYVGAAFAVLAMMVWYAFPGRPPGRLSFAIRGSRGRLRRGLTAGLTLAAVLAIPPLTTAIVILSYTGGWGFVAFRDFFGVCGVAAALALVTGLALAAHNWLEAPPGRPVHASPTSFLQQDRRSSLVGALVAGAVVAVTSVPAIVGGEIAADIATRLLTHWPGNPGLPDLGAASSPLLGQARAWDHNPGLLRLILLGGAFPGTVFALLLLLTRAWPRYQIARLVLAAGGQLPWRLSGFLTDARDRGLLRQSGGIYQFRHIRLQERLADQALDGQPAPRRQALTTRVRHRRHVLVLAAVASVIWISLVVVRPTDVSQAVLTGHAGLVEAVVFSPDGRTLATGSDDDTARLWNVTNPAHPRPLANLIGATGYVYAVAFSPDGHTLATGSSDGSVRLWNVTDPANPRQLANLTEDDTYAVYAVAFSLDGHTLATGDDDTVRLWNVSDPAHPRPLANLTGHTSSVEAVAFSPDGRTLATSSYSQTAGLWNVADPAHPKLQAVLAGKASSIDRLAFSPDGNTLATGSDATAQLWNVTEPARPVLRATFTSDTGSMYWLAFSPDGHTLATGGDNHSAQLWNVTDPAHPDLLEGSLAGHSGAVYAVAFSPDGHTLATGSDDHTTRLWKMAASR